MKVGIWGIGERTERHIKFGYYENVEIIFFVDSMKFGEKKHGIEVISPLDVVDRIEEIDYLIISTIYYSEIIERCLALGINRNKIICTDYIKESYIGGNIEEIKKDLPKLYEDCRMRCVHLMFENEKDDFDISVLSKNEFRGPEYRRDYYRYRTLEFVAREIQAMEIKGAIAELGVFRGTFSAVMNALFPKNKLYLFDTFEGFDQEEAKKEALLGRSTKEFEFAHKKTSEDIVKDRLVNPENVIFCKGLFPDTVTEKIEQEHFALVSIDVDYEKSIYEGLKFFYPRLIENGYVFVHDYNSQYLTGVKEAVEQYEKEIGMKLKKVPLADRAGTLVIVK